MHNSVMCCGGEEERGERGGVPGVPAHLGTWESVTWALKVELTGPPQGMQRPCD